MRGSVRSGTPVDRALLVGPENRRPGSLDVSDCRTMSARIATALALAVLTAGCGRSTAQPPPATPAATAPRAMTPAEIAARGLPSVVTVRTGQSLGTGFIVRADGWIATNLHVVIGGPRVKVTLRDGRELDSKVGTAAKVRVHVEWSDHRRSWSTVGVSENVIEASWDALTSALRLELMRLADKDGQIELALEDYCWGV